MKLRYPSITGKNEQQRIQQIEAYLRYLVDALNYLLEQRA